ncbi:MAG TPA: hypothetical protein VFF03_07240 [Rhodocyclaceae bacterium]|nr:hypothetical protein [Rhodocyclaceae bacterium]
MNITRQSACLGLAGILLAGPALADDAARIRELEKKLERSMQRIDELSAKVQRLEQGATAAAPAADQEARVEALERRVGQLGDGISRRVLEDNTLLRGFADVGAGYSGENNPSFGRGRKGFGVGNLDLYLTPQIGERVRSLVELNFEVGEDGHTDADLERAQLGYAFSDAATVWLGRFHTPYGYWNTAYHHGAQLQTSLSRPRFLDFEDRGGILPAHTVGTWLSGSVPAAAGQFGYDLYGGNAQRIETDAGRRTLNPMAWGRRDSAYTAGFNAWLEPGAVDGLRLGLHGLRSTIEDDAAAPNRTRLAMVGGYGVYQANHWEVLAEYFQFGNRDLSGGSGLHRSRAGYAQAGYAWGAVTPYARLESARLDQRDSYFLSQYYGRSYRRGVLGLRYDLDPRAALKFEFANTDQRDLGAANDRYNEARIQYSIRF